MQGHQIHFTNSFPELGLMAPISNLNSDPFSLLAEPVELALPTTRLGASKSPIIEALVFCALSNWGIKLESQETDEDVVFKVFDFKRYLAMSALICSKRKPTEDEGFRVKALRRWFPDFPGSRDRKRSRGESFTIHVRNKDNKPKKLKGIIKKTRDLIGSQSR